VTKEVRADVWKGSDLVAAYLRDVRGGIPFGADQIEIAMRVAKRFVPDAMTVLDLGSGDGVVAGASSRVFPGASLTLLDFSPGMLDAARTRFADRNNTRFIEADFSDIAWLDALGDGYRADIVFSAYAIHHQEDDRKLALYRELFGLLNPGGAFVNIEHVLSPTTTIGELNDDLFIDTLTAHQVQLGTTASREAIAREFYFRPDKAANRLTAVETQLGWLRDIGFLDVDCYFKVFELAVFGGRKPE
jgi:ubiquinone/menaquinone biosynthesis C-methylase UbiE